MTQKTNPWTFDVRVRDRNLKAGTVTDKDVEKYLGGLPDLTDQSESFGTASQPALLQPVVELRQDPVDTSLDTSTNGVDEGDEEDDEEDEEEVEEVVPVEPTNAPE